MLHSPIVHRRFFLRSPLLFSTLSHPQSPNPNPNPNPYNLMREDPIEILSNLWVRSFSQSQDATFPNLAGFLKKFDLWVLAYQRSVAHHTGAFPPKSAIHLPHLRSLLSLSLAALAGPRRPYPWGAATHLLLRSPTDSPSTKPISRRKFLENLRAAPPPFQDQVVQELLLLVLEPIFEPKFSSRSFAFRPGRSAHTVMRTIRSNFAGYLWFLKADLTCIADSFDPEVIIGCVKKGVTCKKVLGLIKSALKMPVRLVEKEAEADRLTKKRLKRKVLRRKRRKVVLDENEPKPDPYWLRTFFSFAPKEAEWVPEYGHCGILSPLLANVCLDELDKWMEERIEKYFRPSRLDSIWKESIDEGCHNPAWPEFVPSRGRRRRKI